ncbi:MAG: hypothetical protein KAU20_05550 [Nanoarchaeota archaeon]|nr:hypothetical protein [Nanoarchaeota archaeon]
MSSIQVEVIYRCHKDCEVVKRFNEKVLVVLEDYETEKVHRTYEVETEDIENISYLEQRKATMLREFNKTLLAYDNIISIKVQRLVGV